MPTLDDVRFKIQEISNRYFTGVPSIHVEILMSELKATKQDILLHLDELEKQGMITYHASLHDVFSLAAKAREDDSPLQAPVDSAN